MNDEKALHKRRMYKLHNSQSILLWSQVFTMDPRKVRESNILGFYIRIRGGSAKALERAYNKVIETNDSLRLCLCRTGILKIRQYIDDFAYIKLPEKTVVGQAGFENYLRLIRHPSIQMFGGHLTWAELVTIQDDSVVLVMRFHHLIMDGYSISLIFSRITEAYEQYMQGTEPEPKQYSILHGFDVQNAYKASVRHTEDRKFWKDSFNTQPRYSFPAGRRSPKGECAMQEISIDNKLYRDAAELSSRLCCSMQGLIMSAAAFTVYKLTHRTNFCINSLTHGRYDADARRTIGCLMNMIPVFYDLDPDWTAQKLIREEYMIFLESLKHGQLSLTEQTPLSYREPILHGLNFNHAWMLISVMDYGAAFSNSAYEAKMIAAVNQPYQFYAMILEVPGERIDIRLRYQTHKFSADQVSRFLEQYLDTLVKVTQNPDIQLSRI